MIFLQFVPFILIIFFANLGEKYRGWHIVTYILLLILDALCVAGAAMVALVDFIQKQGLSPESTGIAAVLGYTPNMPALAITLLAIGLLAALVLLPFVRRALSRIIPIDPRSVVHATALAYAIYLAGEALIPLALMNGDISNLSKMADVAMGHSEAWQQTLAFVLLAFAGVGGFVRRDGRAILKRLTLQMPTWRQIILAVGVVVGFLALDIVISLAWNALDPTGYERVGQVSKEMLGGLYTPLGAITLGLSAGIGEETLFRGALTPRFGIIVSSLLFTVVHVQYAFSPALLEILIIGLVLGWVRQRANTTTSIIIHSLYNFLGIILIPLYP